MELDLIERLRHAPCLRCNAAATELARLTDDYALALAEVARRSKIIGRAAALLDLHRPNDARDVLREGMQSVSAECDHQEDGK